MSVTKKQISNEKGITLIALVVTIVILIILATISVNIVMNGGLIDRAEKSAEEYEKAKAYELLDMTLAEAHIQKYDEGLTDEQLDSKIKKINGELLPKEEPNSNNQQVIVGGYIFLIDRSVPKIVDYVCPADGIVITARISGNDEWVKPSEGKVTITGLIKTYSGGTIINSTATKDGSPIKEFPTTGGNYTIDNIASDTIIEINATDSNGKTNKKVIPITVKVDNIPPVLSDAKAEAEGKQIKISVKAKDNETGLKQIKFSVSPSTISPATGIIESGKELELKATETREYTITFTAEDNAGTTAKTTVKATTFNGISMLNLKKIVTESTWKDYVGEEVNYKPKAGGTWRVFYYDANNYFGDGNGTIYLKRDYDSTAMNFQGYKEYYPVDDGALMRQLNPDWRDSGNSEIDTQSEHWVGYACDKTKWLDYATAEVKYAVGASSLEMFMRAYNEYKGSTVVRWEIPNKSGYAYKSNGDSTTYLKINLDGGPGNVFCTDKYQYLASPDSYILNYNVSAVCTTSFRGQLTGEAKNVCPIVAICQ